MTREIKFRYWEKPDISVGFEGKMHYDSDEYFNKWCGHPDYETMQFTGLLDKNGKEIYESDYLGDWCVFWGSGKYILQNISTGDIIDCNEENTQQKEITGNRFEHPRKHKAMETDL